MEEEPQTTGNLRPDILTWLTDQKLDRYKKEVASWCHEKRFIDLLQILENHQEFVKSVREQRAAQQLPDVRPLEIKRVERQAQELQDSRVHGYCGPEGNEQKYKIYEPKLGSGKTADVYKCLCEDGLFAVKKISLRKLQLEPKGLETIRREVQILLSLQHPHVVCLHDVVERADNLFLVLECVDGGDLFKYVTESELGRLSERTTAHCVGQIVVGLQYVHAKDVIHRDLKLENILVDRWNSRGDLPAVKLTDFGHSKMVNDGYTVAASRLGTPQYWAPEVSMSGGAPHDYKVDLWSLGVVTFVMLNGAYPFKGSQREIDAQIRNPKVVFSDETSEGAQAFVRALVRYNPAQRLSLDGCLAHEWLSTTTVEQYTTEEVAEERFPLVIVPTRQELDRIKKSLHAWMTRFKCSAKLRNGEVVAGLGMAGADIIDSARAELHRIIFDELGIFNQKLSVAEGVDSNEIGLDAIAEVDGMRIARSEVPGLQEGDVILMINGVRLQGERQEVERSFAEHCVDAAAVIVRRSSFDGAMEQRSIDEAAQYRR